jgi:hypothetical protein
MGAGIRTDHRCSRSVLLEKVEEDWAGGGWTLRRGTSRRSGRGFYNHAEFGKWTISPITDLPGARSECRRARIWPNGDYSRPSPSTPGHPYLRPRTSRKVGCRAVNRAFHVRRRFSTPCRSHPLSSLYQTRLLSKWPPVKAPHTPSDSILFSPTSLSNVGLIPWLRRYSVKRPGHPRSPLSSYYGPGF